MSEKLNENQRARADAHFKAREILKADAAQARQDYYAAQQAVLERTKQLREQRVAGERPRARRSGS